MLENSDTVATMIYNVVIYRKMENRRIKNKLEENNSLFYNRAWNFTSFLLWLLSCRESERKIRWSEVWLL